jgi:hypothetical protein
MINAIRRRSGKVRDVEFCDECGQVCSASCLAEAHRDRAPTELAAQLPFPR